MANRKFKVLIVGTAGATTQTAERMAALGHDVHHVESIEKRHNGVNYDVMLAEESCRALQDMAAYAERNKREVEMLRQFKIQPLHLDADLSMVHEQLPHQVKHRKKHPYHK